MKIFYNTTFYNENILLEMKMMTEDGDAIYCALSSIIMSELNINDDNKDLVREYVFKELKINNEPLPDYILDIEEKLGPKDSFERTITSEGQIINTYFIDRVDIETKVNDWISSKSNEDEDYNTIEWKEDLTFIYNF